MVRTVHVEGARRALPMLSGVLLQRLPIGVPLAGVRRRSDHSGLRAGADSCGHHVALFVVRLQDIVGRLGPCLRLQPSVIGNREVRVLRHLRAYSVLPGEVICAMTRPLGYRSSAGSNQDWPALRTRLRRGIREPAQQVAPPGGGWPAGCPEPYGSRTAVLKPAGRGWHGEGLARGTACPMPRAEKGAKPPAARSRTAPRRRSSGYRATDWPAPGAVGLRSYG
jgi:hypothetical protein